MGPRIQCQRTNSPDSNLPDILQFLVSTWSRLAARLKLYNLPVSIRRVPEGISHKRETAHGRMNACFLYTVQFFLRLVIWQKVRGNAHKLHFTLSNSKRRRNLTDERIGA